MVHLLRRAASISTSQLDWATCLQAHSERSTGRCRGDRVLWSEAGTPDSNYQIRLLDFLVSNLLLGQSEPFPVPPDVTEPMPGVFQHHVSGTAYPQLPTQTKQAKDTEKRTNRP